MNEGSVSTEKDGAKNAQQPVWRSILQGFGMAVVVLIISEIHNANAHGSAGMLTNLMSQNTLGIFLGAWAFFCFIMIISSRAPKT
jgi:hypothetical protein